MNSRHIKTNINIIDLTMHTNCKCPNINLVWLAT